MAKEALSLLRIESIITFINQLLKSFFLIIEICSAINPNVKKISPERIEISAPLLTPRPSKRKGKPHKTPNEIQMNVMGKNTRRGLNITTMFIISLIVSNAVETDIVLLPAILCLIEIGSSKPNVFGKQK
jgi:hypothetical protein